MFRRLSITKRAPRSVPPAASIFFRAVLLNLCAVTRERLRELAVAEDLDQLAAAGPGRAPAAAPASTSPCRESPSCADVHDRVLDAEDVGEAALRDAADERHLAALEAGPLAVAGARLLALVAPAGGLAEARAGAAADALARVLAALWRGEARAASSLRPRRSRPRCGILATMPRTAGVSSRIDLVTDAPQAEAAQHLALRLAWRRSRAAHLADANHLASVMPGCLSRPALFGSAPPVRSAAAIGSDRRRAALPPARPSRLLCSMQQRRRRSP